MALVLVQPNPAERRVFSRLFEAYPIKIEQQRRTIAIAALSGFLLCLLGCISLIALQGLPLSYPCEGKGVSHQEPAEGISTHNLRQVYEETGRLPGTFPLVDAPAQVYAVLRDSAMYQLEVARNKKLFRVPYIMTQSIMEAANDENIVKVVSAILDTEDLVMWGPNIQEKTPNQANFWHTDLESKVWPSSSVTVFVGLKGGCFEKCSTICIPGSHKLAQEPWSVDGNNEHSESVLKAAQMFNASLQMDNFAGYDTGRFYVFDAQTWHAGNNFSDDRIVLILHYQKASDPRIPYMRSYMESTFFDFPAPFMQVGETLPDAVNYNLAVPVLKN
eukprot:CAMPEP_0198294292 /NCGR_PEP_ID=MMETSP1449-20131203/21659_1 /TAXON_ID=420275 /ORGANISM="Attheya septentrionalis, Strain CCMP2084" /LENGTH=330 /DNA_ID=CAMNT_0043994201 /DNA_START=92 /DNA_END=1084 /DNA_ORIENTATION=+